VYFAPGADGAPENYGDIRFTVPAGGDGLYRIETAVRSLFDSTRSRDADFHVVHNGTELFGRFLPPNSAVGYSNAVTLHAGDTIDFAVGRGEDGTTYDTGLKIQASLTLLTNVPPPLPPTNCIPAALPLLAQLIDYVTTLGSGVNTQPLLASLRAAQASLQRDSLASAVGQLHAFQNQVRAQVGLADPALADELIARAEAVINSANCPAARLVARGVTQPVRIESMRLESQIGNMVAFIGSPGTHYEVHVSENLTEWRNAGIAEEIAPGVFQYLDAETPRPPSRFYRVMPSADQAEKAAPPLLRKGKPLE
jgi:hypothetical protein